MDVLRAPDVDHDLHLADIHPNDGTRALLGIRLLRVLMDVPDVPPAYLERHLLLPEALGEALVRPVAQDGYDGTGFDLVCHLERHRDRGP